jgi:LmbE family N-acetylglucosaminyl deacetylase
MWFDIPKPRVLAIGAHPDDIELGCGGFIRRLFQADAARIRFFILSRGLQHPVPGRTFSPGKRIQEAEDAAEVLGVPAGEVRLEQFEDCKLHLSLHAIIQELELEIVGPDGEPNFDLVLTHAGVDTHFDHETTCKATLAATRSFHGTLLLYQSVSTEPTAFRPNYFVSLDSETIEIKQEALRCHESQRDKPFMQLVRTEGMAKSWGVFHRRPDAFFEAFELHKSYWW